MTSGTPSGTATDVPPTIYVAARSTHEGGLVPYLPITDAQFVVRRVAHDAASALPFTYTIGGTATPGEDYNSLSGTGVIEAFQTETIISVPLLSDDKFEPDETITMTITGYGNHSATITIRDATPRMDIDSNNDSGFDPDPHPMGSDEDAIEDDPTKPGKIIAVDDGDSDGDGIPDFADGFGLSVAGDQGKWSIGSGKLVPITITFPAGAYLQSMKLKIDYDANDPLNGGVLAPADEDDTWSVGPGSLRLWKTQNASRTRDARDPKDAATGEFIRSGVEYSPWHLGVSSAELGGRYDGDRSVTLWAEAVRPSQSLADQRAEILIEINGGFFGVDTTAITNQAVIIKKVISDQIPGFTGNYGPFGTGYDGPEHTGIFQGRPSGGHYPQPNYLLLGTRGGDDRLYAKVEFLLNPDSPQIRSKLMFGLFDERSRRMLVQSGGNYPDEPDGGGSAPFIPNTITAGVASVNGYLLSDWAFDPFMEPNTVISDRMPNAVPNVYVAWGIDANTDGMLSVAEKKGRSTYRIKPVDQRHVNAADAALQIATILLGKHTKNFVSAFRHNGPVSGATNYPLADTLTVNDFKLDHNVGAVFAANNIAPVDRAEFVPVVAATIPDPSTLADDVAKSTTMYWQVRATIDANFQNAVAWFNQHPAEQDDLYVVEWPLRDKEMTFVKDANDDLYTAMGDVRIDQLTLRVNLIRKSISGTTYITCASYGLRGEINDTYDYRADTWPAILGANVQAGYDGTPQRSGGRVFKYKIKYENWYGAPLLPTYNRAMA